MCDSQNDITTQNHAGACCTGEAQTTSRGRTTDRWLDGSDVLDVPLPADLQSALGRFVGKESVDTLGEWATEIRRLTGGGSIAVEELCHASAETDHWGDVGDERYYFQCFYDAVILAAVEERPVDVHTVSPGGTVVEARAVGSDELSVTPTDAVFSLGIDEHAGERSGGDPTLEDGYAAICPYVRAFPDREAYEQWAADVPAATVALPLAGATDVASALVV
ncbi:alkylmercury lyase [Halorubrum sp. CBA1125]|uniref:organomercurial lyase n=1 Tax=Halorubrum sp. CBA1125 TaxID=2668072 RepID=UPI0012E71094|nr:organomercurial lyase [Halorubrum sp. CBA1125]MUW14832.1 alkylmercury lyase [Halorubrum sp. CBA1125]